MELQGGEAIVEFVGVKVQKVKGELYGFGERSSVNYHQIDSPSDSEVAAFEQSGQLADLNLKRVAIEGGGLVKTVTDRRENLPIEIPVEAGSPGTGLRLTSQRIDGTGRVIEGP